MQLNVLRQQIEAIDKEIIKQLAIRQDLCRQIGKLKKAKHISIEDPNREGELFALYSLLAKQYDLNISYVEKIFALIINESRKIQL
ncbi:MAG: hypothetical protein A3F18_00680 [Legionellales bacterium RIFCSPHIGHO2_12_FULL_37_14]|nr:MAG: hypothetical protein A3F18_00680 [Legionellales bacterium RIFCSPHIGHO2_12_FULL_37_14]